ncbi:MAG: hypothetical protein ABIT08_09145 [Bacteroidia bacterium]
MVHLEKSWLPPIAGRKKFFSSTFYHKLSQQLDKKRFEIVYEGYADPFDLDSEQPDVVIYDKKGGIAPALLIEFCNDSNQGDVLRTIQIISEVYEAKEAYVYNFQSDRWFRFSNVPEQKSETSFSNLLGIDMKKTFNSGLNKYYLS